MWVQALRDCGITDVDPARTLYFGPSQNAGPGSGWQETFKNRKHVDYRLRFGSDELPGPKAFIRLSPAGYQCKDGRELSFKIKTDIVAHVSTLPLSAELSNDLKWARTIRISVGGMGWDELNESDYEEYFRKTLGPGNEYYQDMNDSRRLVLRRALAVENLVMVYEFYGVDAAWLKKKYQGPLGGQGSGDIGGGFSADWHESNDLMITAPARAWVLGELVSFQSSTGFDAATPQDRASVKIVPASAIVAENQHRLAPPLRQ